MSEECKRLSAKARSHVMYYGGRLKGEWWKPRRWSALQHELDERVAGLLAPLRAVILALDEQIAEVERRLEEMERPATPRGMGTVIFQQLEREICDWGRFADRKQVGGYTGLCPCEDTSAERRFQGSITKRGNPRAPPAHRARLAPAALEQRIRRHREVARQARGGQADQGQQEEDRGGHRAAVRHRPVEAARRARKRRGARADHEGGQADGRLGRRARPTACENERLSRSGPGLTPVA